VEDRETHLVQSAKSVLQSATLLSEAPYSAVEGVAHQSQYSSDKTPSNLLLDVSSEQFFEHISHELKTPVTALTLAVRLLERLLDASGSNPSPATLKPLVRNCVESVDRLRGILEQQLTQHPKGDRIGAHLSRR
jgi:signal transduction histidine kinase